MSRFDKSLGPLQDWGAGEPVSARKLNRHIARTNALVSDPMVAQQVWKRVSEATDLQVALFVPAESVTARRDYFYAWEFTGVTSYTGQLPQYDPYEWLKDYPDSDKRKRVLKPFELRQSPYDQKTINGITYDYSNLNDPFVRLATRDPDTEERQVITPPYDVLDVNNNFYPAVVCIRGNLGGSAHWYWGERVDDWWLDINIAGRAWAKEA